MPDEVVGAPVGGDGDAFGSGPLLSPTARGCLAGTIELPLGKVKPEVASGFRPPVPVATVRVGRYGQVVCACVDRTDIGSVGCIGTGTGPETTSDSIGGRPAVGGAVRNLFAPAGA